MQFPRLLVVLAHPDDEVLALGARLDRLVASRLLTLTDGAPTDGRDARHHGFASLADYRAARQAELQAALADAGLPPWIAPELAQQVPDQTAALHLVTLAEAIAEEITSFAPEAVLTHPYEGGHPDHDACAFAVHAAVQLLATRSWEKSIPVIIEAPFYHAGENGSMRTGEFLQPTGTSAIVCELTERERISKRRRLACFGSQRETLEQFGVDRELFRLAPEYEFTAPPHTGRLFYEQFDWGMSGGMFRRLAMEAIAQLLNAHPSADPVSVALGKGT